MNIGENIRLIRELKGWSQQGLGDVIGSSQKYISRIETGEVSPRLSTLEKISDALDIPLHRFLFMNKKKLLHSLQKKQHYIQLPKQKKIKKKK